MPDRTVRLAGRLPDGDKNGLPAIAPHLVSEPSEVRVAIVLLDCSQVTTKVDDDASLPTVRIRAIEPMTETADSADLMRLLRRAFERRTGMRELPLEFERALDTITPEDIIGPVPTDDGPLPAPHSVPTEDTAEDTAPDKPAPAPDARRGHPSTGLFLAPPPVDRSDEGDDDPS